MFSRRYLATLEIIVYAMLKGQALSCAVSGDYLYMPANAASTQS